MRTAYFLAATYCLYGADTAIAGTTLEFMQVATEDCERTIVQLQPRNDSTFCGLMHVRYESKRGVEQRKRVPQRKVEEPDTACVL